MAKKNKDTQKDNKKSKKEKLSLKEALFTRFKFLKDEKFRIITGLLILFFTIYLTLAFVSYLFTWKIDYSKLDIAWVDLIKNSDITVENWAGKTGAFISNKFVSEWFGIASYSAIFILLLVGLRFFKIKLLPIRKTFKFTLIGVIWISVFLGLLFGNKYLILGGSHGYFISKWLNSFIGVFGTASILLITAIAFVLFTFNNSLELFKKYLNKIFKINLDEESPIVAAISENNEAIEVTPGFDKKDSKEDLLEAVTNTETKTEENKSDDFEFSIGGDEEDTQAGEVIVSKELIKDETQSENNNEASSENVSVNLDNTNAEAKTEQKENVILDNDAALKLTVETIEEEIGEEKQTFEPQGDYDPTLDLSHYKIPPLDLLEDYGANNTKVDEEELISNKNRIVDTLANYKIKIDKIKATIGPTVTLYEIVPAPGVRISKIKNLEDDIALSLSALGIRIIAPIPGKGTIGIEVPNQKPEIVSMKSILNTTKFQESKYELPLALGKTISNETFIIDLAKMPHLLVAGATGQGKSVGVNAIITSLLYKKHPAQVKFVLIDPKKVELSIYSKIERHFLAKLPDTEEPIITDTQKVVTTLNSLTVEMDQRYDLLKKAFARNIKEYNAKFVKRKLNPENGHKYLPYIVVIIDEFADLIMTAGKEIEAPIARIAQLARAVGIHLIIATQRPSTNIITGVIKANFPGRIAFRVSSMIDSRTILDSPGANHLIGKGDMLISQGSDLIRVQCAFVDTPEVDKITDYIGSQQAYPSALLLPEYVGDEGGDALDIDLKKRDEKFDDAARLMVLHQQGSTSLIQRKFSIGYNRAGRIIDQLEAAGIVGHFEGSKARKVLIADEYALEQFLNTME